MDQIQKLCVAKAHAPPCCLRVHPLDPNLIILGTYALQKNGKRDGSLEIWRYDQALAFVTSVPTDGAVLDLKFSPFQQDLLVSAHSTGNLMVWRYEAGSSPKLVVNAQCFDRDDLITSLAFSPILENYIVVTLTSGSSALVTLQNDRVSEPEYLTEHSLECWTSGLGSFAGLEHIVMTGGDDRQLIACDLRSKSPIFQTDRLHEAGVVSILPSQKSNSQGLYAWNSNNPYEVWTGSYDDCLRSLDLRVMAPMDLIPGLPPREKSKQNLGGGVWRLCPAPNDNDNRLLACCMYDGGRILSVGEEPQVDAWFKGDHSSITYGGDWSANGLVATCSFYDHVVHVWDPDNLR